MMSESQKLFEQWVINHCCANLSKTEAGSRGYYSMRTRQLWRAWSTCYSLMEAENQKLRDQRDAANAQIQLLNSIIAGDIE